MKYVSPFGSRPCRTSFVRGTGADESDCAAAAWNAAAPSTRETTRAPKRLVVESMGTTILPRTLLPTTAAPDTHSMACRSDGRAVTARFRTMKASCRRSRPPGGRTAGRSVSKTTVFQPGRRVRWTRTGTATPAPPTSTVVPPWLGARTTTRRVLRDPRTHDQLGGTVGVAGVVNEQFGSARAPVPLVRRVLLPPRKNHVPRRRRAGPTRRVLPASLGGCRTQACRRCSRSDGPPRGLRVGRHIHARCRSARPCRAQGR